MSQPLITLEEAGRRQSVETTGVVETAEVVNAPATNAEAIAPFLIRKDIADGAADTNITIRRKCRVVDAWAVKTAAAGGVGDSVVVKNGATAISDVLSLNVADKIVARAAEIDDAQAGILAGGQLRFTTLNGTNNACTVYVLLAREA